MRTWARGEVLRYEARPAPALPHEAHTHRLPLPGYRKAAFFGKAAHLGLREASQGEQNLSGLVVVVVVGFLGGLRIVNRLDLRLVPCNIGIGPANADVYSGRKLIARYVTFEEHSRDDLSTKKRVSGCSKCFFHYRLMSVQVRLISCSDP